MTFIVADLNLKALTVRSQVVVGARRRCARRLKFRRVARATTGCSDVPGARCLRGTACRRVIPGEPAAPDCGRPCRPASASAMVSGQPQFTFLRLGLALLPELQPPEESLLLNDDGRLISNPAGETCRRSVEYQ
jgi:hypothetical protein